MLNASLTAGNEAAAELMHEGTELLRRFTAAAVSAMCRDATRCPRD